MIEIQSILDVEKYIDDLDAVVFDLDDTLYPEKDYVRSGYKAVAAMFPQILHMEDELWAAFERKEPAIDAVLEKYGILSCKDATLQTYRLHKPNISLYPGVFEMLILIKKTKKIGIITDGRPEGQHAKLDALGLYSIVDGVIITDELGGVQFRKPNDTAFRMMAEQLEVPFERMCYVGDNIAKDFIAPGKLGMRCIWYRNYIGIYGVGDHS